MPAASMVMARRMGVTKGRVHHHYPLKIDLFFDVHRLGMDLLRQAVEPACCAPGDPLQAAGRTNDGAAACLNRARAIERHSIPPRRSNRLSSTSGSCQGSRPLRH